MHKTKLTVGLILLQVLTLGSILWFYRPGDQVPIENTSLAAEVQPDIQLFFTNPYLPSSKDLRGGPDEQLAAAIRAAEHSVDLAVYNLNLWSIRDALLEAAARGVHVRIVTESNNLDSPEIRSLQQAGIPVDSDNRSHLMHHKFVVIDGVEVWTGSTNFTVNGAYRNNNHMIRMVSPEMAANFTNEFEEMFVYDAYGELSISDNPYPEVLVGDTLIEVYFSPDEGKVAGYQISSRIVDLIYEAERSVYLLAFAFTSDSISQAMFVQHQAGLDVRGVVEASQINASGADARDLRAAGVDIRLDGNPNNMHHKVIILDERVLILGSYNFTRSAEEKNDENLLILHSPALAAEFLIEFDKIYQNATISID